MNGVITVVAKEGPAKNVIVNFKRYHSHIDGNEIKEQMMTLLV